MPKEIQVLRPSIFLSKDVESPYPAAIKLCPSKEKQDLKDVSVGRFPPPLKSPLKVIVNPENHKWEFIKEK